jgi:WhiB family redox-sensing transcriptional regulator
MKPDSVSTGPGGTTTRLPALPTPGAASDVLGDWILRAACAKADPEIFFPASDGCDAEAKALCASCPVRPDCLEYSLATGPNWGVWGGLNETERESLARRRKRERQRARASLATALRGMA